MSENNNLPVYQNNELSNAGALPTGFENSSDFGESNVQYPIKLLTDKDNPDNFFVVKRDLLGKAVRNPSTGKTIKEVFCPSKIKMVVVGVARGVQVFEANGTPVYAYAGSKNPEKKALYDKWNFNRNKPDNVEEVEDVVGLLIDPQPTGKIELVYIELKRTSIYRNRNYMKYFRENPNVPVYSVVTTIEMQKQKNAKGNDYWIPMLNIDTETQIPEDFKKVALDAAIRFSKVEGPGLIRDINREISNDELEAVTTAEVVD